MTTTTSTPTNVTPSRVDTLDVDRIRADFPILLRKVYGKQLVYLDSAATTQKPEQVIRAMSNHYRNTHANVHRGIYALSAEATALYEGARKKVADFIGAPDTSQVIFTRNTSESINLVAHAWGTKNLKAGDEILLTEMEHHSNLVPWFLLAKRTGAVVRHIPIDSEGMLDLERGFAQLSDKTKIVAVTHTSNVLGTINPIDEIIARAHAQRAIVLIDAAQGVPHAPVDVVKMNADFVAFSAHKMLGPSGVGVLYGRRDLLEAMDPFMGGGDMISNVTLTDATWSELPWKFEAGTPNIASVIGFGAAIDYLSAIGMDRIRQHELDLTIYAMERLQEMGDIDIYGPKDPTKRAGVIAFNERTVHPHDLATILDREGIAVRAGHHCAQPLMTILGQSATARLSFYVHNDRRDVDALMAGLTCAGRFFGKR